MPRRASLCRRAELHYLGLFDRAIGTYATDDGFNPNISRRQTSQIELGFDRDRASGGYPVRNRTGREEFYVRPRFGDTTIPANAFARRFKTVLQECGIAGVSRSVHVVPILGNHALTIEMPAEMFQGLFYPA